MKDYDLPTRLESTVGTIRVSVLERRGRVRLTGGCECSRGKREGEEAKDEHDDVLHWVTGR